MKYGLISALVVFFLFLSFVDLHAQRFKRYDSIHEMYKSDKNPYKQIHLYKMDDVYYVSGINKAVDALSTEDLALLEKKSKTILYDIRRLKRVLNGERIYTNADCDTLANLTAWKWNNLNRFMKNHLDTDIFFYDVKITFVIEPDGTITCPIILNTASVESSKEVIRVLRKTSGHWTPAIINGKYVRSKDEFEFHYVVKTQYIRY